MQFQMLPVHVSTHLVKSETSLMAQFTWNLVQIFLIPRRLILNLFVDRQPNRRDVPKESPFTNMCSTFKAGREKEGVILTGTRCCSDTRHEIWIHRNSPEKLLFSFQSSCLLCLRPVSNTFITKVNRWPLADSIRRLSTDATAGNF